MEHYLLRPKYRWEGPLLYLDADVETIDISCFRHANIDCFEDKAAGPATEQFRELLQNWRYEEQPRVLFVNGHFGKSSEIKGPFAGFTEEEYAVGDLLEMGIVGVFARSFDDKFTSAASGTALVCGIPVGLDLASDRYFPSTGRQSEWCSIKVAPSDGDMSDHLSFALYLMDQDGTKRGGHVYLFYGPSFKDRKHYKTLLRQDGFRLPKAYQPV